ncbi:hypothetical protein QYH69_15740 [Paraburkholderia sp. SARCC-3016]|uniref:hypothetical protein n=1 Tax=Paraburkholderia sp. SARCC-3016 TaxID=3058611 RepID=UPI002807C972|nr:hypothetical protein [Paraburkholderia sp. SARCC-3016]MDQ7978703.1 hypothetical protein [Paraburkholderia sp. SARCC-3016]
MEEKHTEQVDETVASEEGADSSTMTKALEKAKKRGAVTADLMTRPSFMSAHTAMSFVPKSMQAYGEPNIVPMYEEFHKRVKDVCEGDMTTPEALLTAQAMSLNSIYNECAQLAGVCIAEHLTRAETLLRMALKAQAQCTQTLRVLGELKNPKAVSFIKQQNNSGGGPQQVNNGPETQGAAPARAHEEETPIKANELLANDNGTQTMDAGTTNGAGRENQTVEAVGAVDRPDER